MKLSERVEKEIKACHELSDEILQKDLRFLAQREHHNLAALLIHLAEYDGRKLADKEGYRSTYLYCVKVLRYDEGSAYRRIYGARVCRSYPHILDFVAAGEISLTALILLSPVLNTENQERLIQDARGKSKRELEAYLAGIQPRPEGLDSLRRLPARPAWVMTTTPSANAPSGELVAAEMRESLPLPTSHEWQAIVPLSLERIRVGFDASTTVMGLIDRARQVLRHKYPQGRLEDIMKDALEILLERKDPQRRLTLRLSARASAGAAEPRLLRAWKTGRYVPARVKSVVWQRDGGRCAWRFEDGTPCGARDWLEFDHIRPFARGGRSDDPRNVRLLCRAHNGLAAAAAGLSRGPARVS